MIERDGQEDTIQYAYDENMDTHLSMISVGSVSGIAISIVTVLKQWELWMLPILIFGMALLWILHISQYGSPGTRENIYAGYILLLILFHGVHTGTFFDISLMVSLGMILFTTTDNRFFLQLTFLLYLLLLLYQLFISWAEGQLPTDRTTVTRIIFHISFVFLGFCLCRYLFRRKDRAKTVIRRYREIVEHSDEQTEDFLSNISHEFRTPINAVMGLSTLLQKEGNTDHKVRAIYEAGSRLSDQVQDILDYTEIQADRLILSEEVYYVDSFINDLISNVRGEIMEKGLQFVVDIDPMMPRELYGDVERLRRILRHTLMNAAKFTAHGGVYFRMSVTERDYGVNLDIEVTDTGCGMTREEIDKLSNGFYQADKGRDRSTGGIGIGYAIIYGLTHAMEGFVRVESRPEHGTTVRIAIPQKVRNDMPAMQVYSTENLQAVYFSDFTKYKVVRFRDYVWDMTEHLATGLRLRLRCVMNFEELKNLCEKEAITHIFLEEDDYVQNRAFFDEMAAFVTVAVAADTDTLTRNKNRVIIGPYPFYSSYMVGILNAGADYRAWDGTLGAENLDLSGISALIVDDERMNLMVAQGLFGEYHITTDIAESGEEALKKFEKNDYDLIFMDHMMPGMDGVEAMKRLRRMAEGKRKEPVIVALTANAISGAREFFIKEGFDGFIPKPIDVTEFERVMKRVL